MILDQRVKGRVQMLESYDLWRKTKQAGSETPRNKHLQPGEHTDSCWRPGEWSRIQETDHVVGLLSIACKGICWEKINT